MKILLIDNYDSFTYNLLHLFLQCSAEVEVLFCDDPNLLETETFRPYRAIILSPGPGDPPHSGHLMNVVKSQAGKLPIFGVCLGMQAIGLHYGWNLIHADYPMHGKTSDIVHDSKAIFKGIPNPMRVGRYHSLCLEKTNNDLEINAQHQHEIMAVSNLRDAVFGVQFHPESILTPQGILLIQNFMEIAKNSRTL